MAYFFLQKKEVLENSVIYRVVFTKSHFCLKIFVFLLLVEGREKNKVCHAKQPFELIEIK